MRKSKPKQINNVISSVIQQLGLGPKIKQHELLDAWPRIVGDQIAKVTTATSIVNGKLVVRVKYATWRNELIFLKRGIISKINKEMNQEFIKDILFK